MAPGGTGAIEDAGPKLCLFRQADAADAASCLALLRLAQGHAQVIRVGVREDALMASTGTAAKGIAVVPFAVKQQNLHEAPRRRSQGTICSKLARAGRLHDIRPSVDENDRRACLATRVGRLASKHMAACVQQPSGEYHGSHARLHLLGCPLVPREKLSCSSKAPGAAMVAATRGRRPATVAAQHREKQTEETKHCNHTFDPKAGQSGQR